MAWLVEGAVDDDAPSNHGSPYLYDRRVPIVAIDGHSLSFGRGRDR
jgi:hypothetical protein